MNTFDLEDGLVVFTREYLLSLGKCCHSGCRNCPYNEDKMIKNEFRIVEKKSKEKEGILTYYAPQYRCSNHTNPTNWYSAHKNACDPVWFGWSDIRCSTKEEAMQHIEECKKALEIYQYENIVYEEST